MKPLTIKVIWELADAVTDEQFAEYSAKQDQFLFAEELLQNAAFRNGYNDDVSFRQVEHFEDRMISERTVS